MMDLEEITLLSPTPHNTYMTNATNYSYNTKENVLDFAEESRTEAIIYGILFLLALCGNFPVLISLIRSRRQRSRIEEMILHLIIADLIVACVVIPLEISWRITVEWIAGDALCKIMLFLRAFGPYLSSMVIVCISIDQFIAIVYPLKMTVAHKRVRRMLRCAWASSFLCSLPQGIAVAALREFRCRKKLRRGTVSLQSERDMIPLFEKPESLCVERCVGRKPISAEDVSEVATAVVEQ
ncbi:Gonadotropin-releasing hormone receptor [Araneus ventricosus]|uniref:Gonadotropin-releasing hormone receptor n=1 Tax=Araneus ventricosus TaxID=182803 RepID=A0A4Y2ITW0_ARAVE|nr:Gonadotropin-releasing hormone receptor [Araneus ventricosus]